MFKRTVMKSHTSLFRYALTGVATITLMLSGIGAVLALSPAAASAAPTQGLTCTGGPIPPGSYGSVTVTGFCFVEGTVSVTGGLTIAPNAALNATDPTTPDGNGGIICTPAHLDVSGGIRVLSNGILFLGDSYRPPDGGTGCPTSNDVVNGGIVGQGSNSVVVHGTQINGGLTLNGGGGGNSYIGPGGTIFCADVVIGSVDVGFPPFSDVEDSQINGGASIVGLNTCWMGFINNQVNGGVTINNNTLGDPDAIEIGLNTIHGGLACSGNLLDPNSHLFPDDGSGGVPTNSFDGSPPNPNTVTGQETGQCAGL